MLASNASATTFPLYRRTSSSAWRMCLCCILCLSVWRGPVPILHEHDLDLQSLGNNAQLAQHAIEYHADKLGQPSAGLHLHIVMLDGSSAALRAGTCSSDTDSSLLSWSAAHGELVYHCDGACQAFSAEIESRADQWARCSLDTRGSLNWLSWGEAPNINAQRPFSTNADMSFLQTQLSGASNCAVLCVFLC